MVTARRRPWLMIVGALLCLVGLVTWAVERYQARQTVIEAASIYTVLQLEPTSRVADVGAGDGTYAIELARTLAGEGYVYASELDLRRLATIRAGVQAAGLDNVTMLESRPARTGLPPACCDGIFLRGVYHHLSEPGAIADDLFRAATPGGRLAIIDFPPSRWLTFISPVDGVPADRGGHGIPPDVVIEELTVAGFTLEERIDDWGGGRYCLVFSRP